MEVFVKNTVGLREVQSGKTMNTHKSSRENSKQILRKLFLKCKTHIFRDWIKSQASRQGQSPKLLRNKIF